ncbi:MAG: molybdate ABC transporter substrate-binding protein [Croceibacterium sp.]
MRLVLVVLAAGLLVSVAAARPESRPTVYAASSLTNVFPKIVPARYSFAGSDTLAAQIRQGAPADVFASANMALPLGLHDDKLCSKPVVFTRNALIVIVPTSNPAGIHSVFDLTRHGVKVVVAAPSVPVGAYTRKVLAKLHLQAVLDNIVSEETDVREVLAKIALGEGDAGFVYGTDARTVPGKVKRIAIPARSQPDVRYGICVVTASSHKTAAHAFVSKVLGPRGQQILRRYGFLPRSKKR